MDIRQWAPPQSTSPLTSQLRNNPPTGPTGPPPGLGGCELSWPMPSQEGSIRSDGFGRFQDQGARSGDFNDNHFDSVLQSAVHEYLVVPPTRLRPSPLPNPPPRQQLKGGYQDSAKPFTPSAPSTAPKEVASYSEKTMLDPIYIDSTLGESLGLGRDAAHQASKRALLNQESAQHLPLRDVISLMNENLTCDVSFAAGCRVLHSRVWPTDASEPDRALLVEVKDCGGFDVIMRGLATHVFVERVVAYCLKLVKDVRRIVEKTPTFANWVNIVLDAIKCHPLSERVQALGCATIGMLAWKNKVTAKHIIKLGGAETIVKTMNGHIGCHHVQCQGCLALTFLAKESNNIIDRIIGVGGANTVLEALRAHPDNAQVQNQGCVALRYLSSIQTGAVVMKAHGCDQLVLAAAAAHGLSCPDIERAKTKILTYIAAVVVEQV